MPSASPQAARTGDGGPLPRPARALRGVGVLGGGMMLAAVLGLGFQSLLAFWFGAGAETDAWFMSLSIFAFVAKFLMFGHFKSIALPLYAHLGHGDRVRADELAGGLFRLSLAGLAGLTVLLLLTAPLLVRLLAPGYDGATGELTVTLLRIRLPGLVFLGAITVGLVVLESRGRFGVTVAAQKVVPAALALVLLLAVGERLGILAVGVIGLLGTAGGAVVVLIAVRRLLPAVRLRVAARDPLARDVGRQWFRFGGSNLATLVGEWAFRVGASLLPVGLFSAVLYGRMVHDLMHGAVNDAVRTASLPRFARLAALAPGEAEEDGQLRLGAGLREAVAALSAVSLPLALCVAMTAPWIVAALFGRGRFLEDGMVAPAAVALSIFAGGFLLQGLVQLVFAAAFASGKGALVNRVQAAGHLARAVALVPLVSAFSYVGLVAAQVAMNALVLGLLVAWTPRAWRLRAHAGLARAIVAAAPAPLAYALLVAPRLPDPLSVGTPERLAVLALVGAGWAAVSAAAALAAGVPGARLLLARALPGRRTASAVVGLAALAVAARGAAAQEPASGTSAPGSAARSPAPDTAVDPPSAPLPDAHWSIPVLEWLEARGALPAGVSAFRPLGADRVATLLRTAATRADGAGASGAEGAAAGALRRFGAEIWSDAVRFTASAGAGAASAGAAGGQLALDVEAARGRLYGWLSARVGQDGPAVHRGGVGVTLGPVRASLGRVRLTFGGGASGAVTLNPSAPVDGLLIHTPRPLALPLLGGVRAAFGLGPVASYEAVDGPWLGVLRVSARPARWLQIGLSRAALVGGHFGGGSVPYDPVPKAPDAGSLSAADVLDILVGRTTDFDDQVAAADARISLAPLGVPALAYAEVGWEEADRSWGDPALVAGLLLAPDADLPLALRYEYVAFGAPARLCAWCDTLPAFWYRHNRFQDGWMAGGQPLGHPLGGYGFLHRLGATAWAPDFGARVSLHVDRLRRDRWNLRFADAPGAAWAAGAEASWRLSRHLEVRGAWAGERGEEGVRPDRWFIGLLYLPAGPSG